MANKYRELCAKAIETNGGYYGRGYSDRYALSWSVPVYDGIPDFDEMLERLKKGGHDYSLEPDTPLDPELLQAAREDWNDDARQERLYTMILEDMQQGVRDADSASYRSVRPDIAKRYGLSHMEAFPRVYRRKVPDDIAYYPTRKQDWILVDPWRHLPEFNVEFEFHGRGGKHLCPTDFEGNSLELSSEDLAEAIRDGAMDQGYSNQWCQKLLAFIHECDLMFTSKAASEEFNYMLLFRFWTDHIEEVVTGSQTLLKEADEREQQREITLSNQD